MAKIMDIIRAYTCACALLVAAVPFVGWAEGESSGEASSPCVAVFTPISGQQAYGWQNVKYWTINGAAATEWPSVTNGWAIDFSAQAGNTVNADPAKSWAGQYLEQMAFPSYKTFSFYSIYGGIGRWLTQSCYYNGVWPTYSITNTTDFLGLWQFQGVGDFELVSSATHTPVLQRWDLTKSALFLKNEEGTMIISNAYGSGKLEKIGAGTLEVQEHTGGKKLGVRVRGGSLAFHHARLCTDAELATLLSEADAHFDASQTNTLTITDGRVSAWADVRGAGYPYAVQWSQNGNKLPLPIHTNVADTSMAVVDFGPAVNGFATAIANGQSAALMFVKKVSSGAAVEWEFGSESTSAHAAIPGVKECFIVQGQTTNGISSACFWGALWDKTFRRGYSGKLILASNAATCRSHTQSELAARDGDFTLDGDVASAYTVVTNDAMHLFTFRARENEAYVGRMGGFAGDYGTYCGGIRVSEAIYFTRFLTARERRSIVNYLNKKWFAEACDANARDLDYWQDETANTTFDVPADEALSIRQLIWNGDSLRKTGAGTLAVDAIFAPFTGNFTKEISVAEGSLEIGGITPNANPTYPADTYRHFDAAEKAPFTFTEAENSTNILTWLDKDNDTDSTKTAKRQAKTSDGQKEFGYPMWVKNGLNGQGYVSFGKIVDSSAANYNNSGVMTYVGPEGVLCNEDNLQTAFVVVRGRKDTKSLQWVFGSYGAGKTSYSLTSYPFFPGNENGKFLRDVYSSSFAQTGEWAVDGTIFDPLQGVADGFWHDWHVIRISMHDKVFANAIGCDRGGLFGNIGGFDLAEMILYDRALTPQESVDTETYLLKKWLKKDHPFENNCVLKNVTLESDAASITILRPATIICLSKTGNTFEKKGPESLLVNAFGSEGFPANVVVSEGSLRLQYSDDSDALYHLDASDARTFTTFTTENADGSLRTNITSWADVRDTGFKANSIVRYNSVTNPALVSIETAAGVIRPAVDFGDYSATLEQALKNNASGLVFSERFTNVHEAITVHLDRDRSSFIFADYSAYNYHRGSSGSLLRDKYAHPGLTNENAIVLVNGTKVNPVTYMTPTRSTYVMSFAQADGYSSGTCINQISLDRNMESGRCGGMACFEQLAFPTKLSAERRTYWTQYLMKKWLNVGDWPSAMTNTQVRTISVATGTSLTLPQNVEVLLLSVSALSGGGTIDGTVLLEKGGTITIPWGTSGPEAITIGNLLLAGNATLALNVAQNASVVEGDYVVARGKFPADICAKLTLSGNFTTRFSTHFYVDSEGALHLKIQPRGLTIFIR